MISKKEKGNHKKNNRGQGARIDAVGKPSHDEWENAEGKKSRVSYPWGNFSQFKP